MKKSKLKAYVRQLQVMLDDRSARNKGLRNKWYLALMRESHHREAHHAAQKGIRRLHAKVASYERFLRDNQIWRNYQQQQATEARVARAKQKDAWLAEHPEDRPAAP